MNEDTEGFYKIDSTSGEVLCGPNFVLNANYELHKSEEKKKEKKDRKDYPDGWYWFDAEQEAYTYFNIEWYPEVYTIGLPKPWLNENTIENG